MPTPQMNQWQMRFDTAMRSAQEPRRPNETPQQAQQRQVAMSQVLRQLQMSKPTGTAPVGDGRSGNPQAPSQGGGGGGVIGSLYNYIGNAVASANKR